MAISSQKDKYIAEVIRVNHAGEYGAKQIYRGQLAVFKDQKTKKLLEHMANQEEEHLKYFSNEMLAKRVRPSVLMPLWHVAGFLLGAGTALLGKNSAMVATEAIEEVIDKHYQEQTNNPDLPLNISEKIEKFRQEEIEHKQIAQENMKDLGPAHKVLYNLIKIGCKASIAIAKKL